MKAFRLFNLALAFAASAMLLAVSGCSTSTSTTDDGAFIDDTVTSDPNMTGDIYIEDNLGYGGLSEDVMTSVDSDGTLVIGDPNAAQDQLYDPTFAGPQALRENNTVYFKYDSDQIQDEYIAVMQAHAQYLRDNPDARIIIEGHTDERGTPEYNIALGERRARSVARYMQNLGVDVNQLSIVSYGEEKPVAPGHNESSWQQNRRAVINY